SGPGDQILHAARGEERALRFQAVNTDVFGIRHYTPLSERFGLRRDRLQSNRAHSGDRRERATPFLLPFGFIEVSDTFFGHYVADVVTVDHDGGDRHSSLLPNLHGVESLDECRNTALLEGLHRLHYEFAAAHDRLFLGDEIEPR